MNLTKTVEWITVGGLSKTSKMGCYSYSISALSCKAGSKLAKIKGSVCERCYARRGRYNFPNVKRAMQRRYDALSKPEWTNMISALIKKTKTKYFRWHDSGDLQGVWHLEKIVEVAHNCPDVKFWLPTKERAMIQEWRDMHGEFPNNLCVRLSAPIKEAQMHSKYGPSSMVIKDPTINNKRFSLCEAFKNDGKCGSCRACWDKSVACIAYKEH